VICGTDKIRKQIENRVLLAEIEADWQNDLLIFKELREQFLLY